MNSAGTPLSNKLSENETREKKLNRRPAPLSPIHGVALGLRSHESLHDENSKMWEILAKEIEDAVDVINSHAGHSAILGDIFIRWVKEARKQRIREELESPAYVFDFSMYLPPIDVAVKLYKLTAVNVQENTFTADFMVMLDWEDPSLLMVKNKNEAAFNVDLHFYPKYDISNAVLADRSTTSSTNARPRLGSPDASHVKWTQRFQGNFLTRIDAGNYPFDWQQLRIMIETISFSKENVHTHFPGVDVTTRLMPSLVHPVRWRRGHGHRLETNADWLPDFQIVGINGERERGAYTVSVAVKRDPMNVICNLVVSQAVTSMVSSCSFFVADYPDAIILVLTALLTSVAFKLVLIEFLPRSPHASAIEKYMMWSYMIFFIQAVMLTTVKLINTNVTEGDCSPANKFNNFTDLFKEPDETSEGDYVVKVNSCSYLTALNLSLAATTLMLIVLQHVYFFRLYSRKTYLECEVTDTWETFEWAEKQADNETDIPTNNGRSSIYTSPRLSCHFCGEREAGSKRSEQQLSDVWRLRPLAAGPGGRSKLKEMRSQPQPIGRTSDLCLVHGRRHCVASDGVTPCRYPKTWLIDQIVKVGPAKKSACRKSKVIRAHSVHPSVILVSEKSATTSYYT